MRESFVIHTEYIEDLPEENKAEFLLYVYNYGAKGVVPELTGLAKTIWVKIQRRIDADIEQYEATINARSNAGRKHKGNQYTKNNNNLEQNGTNGTQSHSVEQNGTNGTVYEFVSDIDSDNEFKHVSDTQNNACVCFDYGKLQRDCYDLITDHNKTAQQGRKIPISGNILSFAQKEMRYLLNEIGTEEPPEKVYAALKNFIKVARSDTWQKSFSWQMFCNHYRDYTQEYFSMQKYLTQDTNTDDATKRPENVFFFANKDNPRFHWETFQKHLQEWTEEGRPQGEDYFNLQDIWEAEKCY